MPTTVVMGRLLTCFFATGYILLVFFIGKRLSNKAAVGLLASAMIAISPINVDQSRYIIENSFLVFFQTFVVWASLLILQRGKTSDYLLAGIATGLAVSSKYPGGLIAIVPLFAHFCNQSLKQGLKDHRIYLFLMLIPMVFFATTPYALINYKKFIEDIFFEGHHYSTGHPGMDGNSLFWYLSYAGETAGLIYLLSLFEMVRGVYLRNKSILLLSIFPVVNFVFISSFVVRNDRTFLPLMPMLCILAASFLVYLFSQVNEIENRILRWCCVFGVIALSVISFVQPTVNTFKDSMRLTVIDSRETSKIWVNENLPAGSKIGIEAFSPFIDPSRFAIQSFDLMIENEPEWYLNHGFDYLLFTQDTYGVFYQESSRYKTEVSAYDELFRRFKLVKIFTDGGLEIRLYKVK
jgi:4-amino-4-deoxy-L-arabinose transferase-like glycosyltransferase